MLHAVLATQVNAPALVVCSYDKFTKDGLEVRVYGTPYDWDRILQDRQLCLQWASELSGQPSRTKFLNGTHTAIEGRRDHPYRCRTTAHRKMGQGLALAYMVLL